MSQALKSERAQTKSAAPERARQAPAEARPSIAEGPLQLETLLYLQKYAGNAAVAEVLEARSATKPVKPDAPAAPGAPEPAPATAAAATATASSAESGLLALPVAGAGIAAGAAGALGSMLGSLIAPAPAPANGKAKPGSEPAHPHLLGKAEGKPTDLAPGSAAATAPTTTAAGEAPTSGGAPPTPETDPNFQAVKGRVGSSAGQSKAHPPAHAKVAEAHAAAVGPANQVASQAGAAQVEKMAGQQPGGFDKQAFMAAVRKAIDASAPHTLAEADDFKDSGKAGQIQGQVSGLVGQNKQQAEGAIKGATEAPPDTSSAQPKPVTPMPEEHPGAAPASVGAASAMPSPKSNDEVSLDKGPAEVNASMAEAEVTEPQLKESNEPEFTGALAAKETAEVHSQEAPKTFRQEEQGTLEKARGSAGASAEQGLQAMHGTRAKALSGVAAGKGTAKGQDEARRAEVSSKIEGLYGKTKDEVTGILNGIDPQVDATFKSGEAQARTAFESHVDARMTAYKDDRYSGLRGKYRWVRDKFAGLPSDVNQFYIEGRQIYLTRMEAVIGSVADIVGRELTRAKERIALGQSQIQQYVATLPTDLKKVGQEAQQSIQSKFDELTQTVDAKQDDLVNDLAKKYVESRDAVDSRIKDMKDANKGLIDRAKDAVMGVINTIRKLKDMLLGVLSKVAGVIGTIISAPIKFLGNLVSGIKMGLTNFMSNIGEHLKKGLLGWLFGALGEAGLQLPEKFDLKGILSIIMQVLGLTYSHIRGLAVGIVGEEVIGHLEKSLGFFQVLIKEGPAGLWKWIVEKISELKDTVMDKIKEFIQEKVIIAGIMWLIGLLNPVAAFVKACKAIYDIVMFFIDRATQVGELVNAIVDSVGAIAGGALGEAAGKVENALAKGIPVAIGFLASLLGLGGISDKIRTIIHAIQEPIHNIISKVLGVVLKPFKWIGNKIKQGAAWAKKKLQQGVAFVKTKAKQGVALVKGKVGGLFGRGESEQSQKVKARAHERLAERITHPMANEAQLKAVAAGVLAELRPDGLKELKVRPSRTEEGRYDFLAAASPETPVFEAKTTVSAAEDLHLRQEAKAAVNAAINPIDPDLASVVGKLLDDTDHPLNLVQALMNPERRAKTISLLKELASAQTLAGQSLEDFIKTHPGSGSLFEALPADVNFDAQGRSRKDQYIEQARTKDPTRGNVPEAQQEEMVKQYVTRLLNEVQPAVTKEVDAVAAQVRAEAGGDPEVNVRTKDAAGLLDKVRRMQAKGRKNYGVADIIDAVGARITVDSTAQIATCLQKVRGHFKTGDTGRILEIENFYANPKPGKESYRVIPITVSIQVGGMPYTFELQLTTRRASIAADIEHNVVYKPYVTPSEAERKAAKRAMAEAAALEQQGG